MKIGLALSGGGALGVAHIGAIEELEKAGIKIDCVSGVSSGAIIGLAYAVGGLDALHKFYEGSLTDIARRNRLIFAKGPDGVFKYISKALGELCGVKKIEELAIQFSCSATNLATGESEAFFEGDPVASVMASSAYPGVFAPQNLNGKWYIDGGATRNLPVEDARAMEADFIIGSSTYAVDVFDDKRAGKMNRIEVAARALDIFEKELSRFREEQCDFCFKPCVDNYKWFDFFKMEEILEQGRANAAKQIKDVILSLSRK